MDTIKPNIHKCDIAIEFLETAAVLLMHEINFFSAIHLAAAAEEISGKMCRIDQKKSYFDDLTAQVVPTLEKLNIEYNKRKLIDAVYFAKNTIKHMDSINDNNVQINPKEEAISFIIAAYRNFEKLGIEESLSNTVKAVIDENMIYIETDSGL